MGCGVSKGLAPGPHGPGSPPLPVLQEGASPSDAAPQESAKPIDATPQEEAPAEVAPELDPDRYTSPDSIWAALQTESVRLPRMSWLIELARAGGVLPRRQDVPKEAFAPLSELKEMYGDGNKDGLLPIIAISFCWDTPQHPDPEGKQLATVAAALEKNKSKYSSFGKHSFPEMGVFWDWPSLYQKDPKLWHPCCGGPAFVPPEERTEEEAEAARAYEESRTEEEKKAFSVALHETMDLWYAHQGTTVYKLTRLPEGSLRTNGYMESGWTSYEECSAEQIKKYYLCEAKWKLVLDLGVSEDKQVVRGWPVGPNDFDALVTTLVFTNKADVDSVKKLYRKMSIGQLGTVAKLDFDGMQPPVVEDAGRLGRCLNLCGCLQSLDLARVGLTDETLVALCKPLASGALAKLQTLEVGDSIHPELKKVCKTRNINR